MIEAEKDLKTAVVKELYARTGLTSQAMVRLDDDIDNEIALSGEYFTVAEIATEIMLENHLQEV